MHAKTIVKSLKVNDGTNVSVPEGGVVVFVGPNNSGKSQALRDISKLVTSQGSRGIVIEALLAEHQGTEGDLLDQLRRDNSVIRSQESGDRVDLGASSRQQLSSVIQWWNNGAQHIVAPYFVLLADTESRLAASRPSEALNLYAQSPTHPIHVLYTQPDLESRLDEVSREAFGSGLILDTWAGGSQWGLRIGRIARPDSPRPDQAYLDDLGALPLLHTQGDGVRSMIGLLLVLTTGHQSISLIDEPEAFLHPPQARFLAKLLATDAAADGQTAFLSTHSTDVVHGILESNAPTTVVRFRRVDELNKAAVLDNEAVRRLWNDPLLRYSNLLEGLFTDAVVVCESDADCKFFASIRDTLEAPAANTRRPDLLFTSCGGKQRIHVGVEALRAASVPVAVIGDFDVLNDWGTLSRLLTSAGGDPSSLENDWRVLSSALTTDVRTPSVAAVKDAVASALENVTVITRKSLAPVRDTLRVENGWDRVKNAGLAGVPKGDAYNAAVRLLKTLRGVRIHLIPVGEMEDFLPGVSGHGPTWLADVLDQRLHESGESEPVRSFLRSVVHSVASDQAQHRD